LLLNMEHKLQFKSFKYVKSNLQMYCAPIPAKKQIVPWNHLVCKLYLGPDKPLKMTKTNFVIKRYAGRKAKKKAAGSLQAYNERVRSKHWGRELVCYTFMRNSRYKKNNSLARRVPYKQSFLYAETVNYNSDLHNSNFALYGYADPDSDTDKWKSNIHQSSWKTVHEFKKWNGILNVSCCCQKIIISIENFDTRCLVMNLVSAWSHRRKENEIDT